MGFWRDMFSVLTLMSLHEGNYQSAGFFGVMTDMEERRSRGKRYYRDSWDYEPVYTNQRLTTNQVQAIINSLPKGKANRTETYEKHNEWDDRSDWEWDESDEWKDD